MQGIQTIKQIVDIAIYKVQLANSFDLLGVQLEHLHADLVMTRHRLQQVLYPFDVAAEVLHLVILHLEC